MKHSTELLVSCLMQYCQAMQEHRYKDAAVMARNLPRHADLMLIHPMFRNRWGAVCPNVDAAAMVSQMSHLLQCLADVRSEAAAVEQLE